MSDLQGRIQKIQKEGAESPTPHPLEWKLHFSGDAAYSIVGVFVMPSQLKWYYDENRTFPIYAILIHKEVEKCCLLFWNISFRSRDIQVFKICKLAKWWRHTLNQILFKYDEKKYLSQFVSEIFDTLQ